MAKGVGLRLLSRRGSWVQIPPSAPEVICQHIFARGLRISKDRKDTAFISKAQKHLFLHGTEIKSPTCFPILIPPIQHSAT
jgi:hypothetical protein